MPAIEVMFHYCPRIRWPTTLIVCLRRSGTDWPRRNAGIADIKIGAIGASAISLSSVQWLGNRVRVARTAAIETQGIQGPDRQNRTFQRHSKFVAVAPELQVSPRR